MVVFTVIGVVLFGLAVVVLCPDRLCFYWLYKPQGLVSGRVQWQAVCILVV